MDRKRITIGLVGIGLSIGGFSACGRPAPNTPTYAPRARAFTITTIPLLTKEMARSE
jgi:hypothetical protein